jgi:PPOX class probable F420-dependent enzyme
MSVITPEVRAFLLSLPHTAKLATVRANGLAHVVPVWFDLDGDTIVFNTGSTTVKARNMQRDPRVCICVDDETPPFAFVRIEGTAQLIDELEQVKHWATRIGGRYMGADAAELYGARNGVPGELVVRITPTRVHFEKDIASF